MKPLEKLMEGFRSYGFVIGDFVHDGHLAHHFYHSYCVNIGFQEIPELGLDTYVQIGLHYELPSSIPHSITHVATLKPQVNVIIRAVEEWDSEEIDESDYNRLPAELKENNELLIKLKNYLESHPKYKEGISLPHREAGLSFGKLYGELIRKGGLRWFNMMGEEFPYVTTSSDVLGKVGKVMGGLYFVSVDIADEPWKEEVVAYHERFCQLLGHEFAKAKERELGKFLSKEMEYKSWRRSIPNLL